jgi:23S rRNA (guanine1835-N2)-methyltransferase
MAELPGSTRFHSPFGEFTLERRPPTPNQPFQAWDATDEYLLDEFARFAAPDTTRAIRALVVNDAFGALALALHEWKPASWGDSRTAQLALADNFARNAVANETTWIPATRGPATAGSLPYRAVLWRIPKSLALFRQQAALLQRSLAGDALVLAGGMIKHLPEQTVEILEGLGRVDILHARKKSRLFRVTPQSSLPDIALASEKSLRIPELDLELEGDANVFARDKFDIGARCFIEQFGKLPRAGSIADLGCGNGILGIVAQRLQPAARVAFFDESFQAVSSAERNYRCNIAASTGSEPQFECDDGLNHYEGAPFDLVLCNPPFHQNHATGDQIAWQMFTQSRQHLVAGGELWVVGNRHLDYHAKMKRVFGNCRQIAGNSKFVVLAAKK